MWHNSNIYFIANIAELEETVNLDCIESEISETLQLKYDFGSLFEESNIKWIVWFTAEPPDASIKDVIKLILNPKICEKLNKTFEVNQSGMMINLFFEHVDESDELKPLWDVKPEVMQERYATPR